jgi:hypothetical protein
MGSSSSASCSAMSPDSLDGRDSDDDRRVGWGAVSPESSGDDVDREVAFGRMRGGSVRSGMLEGRRVELWSGILDGDGAVGSSTFPQKKSRRAEVKV